MNTSHSRPNSAAREAPATSPTGPRRSRCTSFADPGLRVREGLRDGACWACASRPGRRPRTCSRCAPGVSSARSQAPRAEQRRRAPQPVGVAHLVGDRRPPARPRPPARSAPSGRSASGRRGRRAPRRRVQRRQRLARAGRRARLTHWVGIASSPSRNFVVSSLMRAMLSVRWPAPRWPHSAARVRSPLQGGSSRAALPAWTRVSIPPRGVQVVLTPAFATTSR